MKNKPIRWAFLSKILRSYFQADDAEIVNTVQWIAIISSSLLGALLVGYLASENYTNALASAIAMIPILASLALLKQGTTSIPSIVLAVTFTLLITWLSTSNQGLYDIGVFSYPVILIVAGLILRGRAILYLTLIIIVCMAWLVFGDIWNLYQPIYPVQTNLEDFFIGSIVVLIAGNAVYRLSKNVHRTLANAEAEILMRKEAEKEREDVIRRLKLKNQELDRFAIRVSHDLKTPLITLAGFLGYLEKDINEGNFERAKKDFSQINEAAKTMGKFVDELLDLSRVGRITNPPRDVPFNEIIQDSLKAADGILKAKQVQVEVDASFPVVHVDRVRIVQVMQNLITNAVKFMGDQSKPTIKIGCEKVKGQHIFSISDNGIGIALKDRERIFELFNKLDPDTEGTGIGLAMVKRIIEVHGGRIWVESETGKGSTFLFTLENTKQQEIS